MSYPGLDQALVDISSLFYRFLLSGVILNVELFGALRSRHEVDNSLIAFITKLDSRPTCLIKNGLPDIFVDISLAIHDSSIDQDDGM